MTAKDEDRVIAALWTMAKHYPNQSFGKAHLTAYLDAVADLDVKAVLRAIEKAREASPRWLPTSTAIVQLARAATTRPAGTQDRGEQPQWVQPPKEVLDEIHAKLDMVGARSEGVKTGGKE